MIYEIKLPAPLIKQKNVKAHSTTYNITIKHESNLTLNIAFPHYKKYHIRCADSVSFIPNNPCHTTNC